MATNKDSLKRIYGETPSRLIANSLLEDDNCRNKIISVVKHIIGNFY